MRMPNSKGEAVMTDSDSYTDPAEAEAAAKADQIVHAADD
jgi:hypothetical protein